MKKYKNVIEITVKAKDFDSYGILMNEPGKTNVSIIKDNSKFDTMKFTINLDALNIGDDQVGSITFKAS